MLSKKPLIFMLLLFVTVACSNTAIDIKSSPLLELGKQYQTLKNIEGHFEGGEWNDRVDAFDGEKHQLLKQLETYTQTHATSPITIMEYFGEPEERCQPCSGENYLGYYWRGKHDYLILYFDSEVITSAVWKLSQE